jgi:hypothetical protein
MRRVHGTIVALEKQYICVRVRAWVSARVCVRACVKHVRGEGRCTKGFGGGTWAIDGMMILKWIFKKSIERGRGLDYCCSG